MSAVVGSSPPPTPGLVGLVQPGSCVPRPVFNGEPMFNPCPGIVMQFEPSVRPMSAHVWLIKPPEFTCAPGNVRYVDAMLPEGASLSNAGVSYQAGGFVTVELFRSVSYAKNAKMWSFQSGPPMVPPIWLNCCVSLCKPRWPGLHGTPPQSKL